MPLALAVVVPLITVLQPALDDGATDSTRRGGAPPTVQEEPSRTRHAVYFGVGYQPGMGPRLTGTYEYAGLPSSVLSLTLGWSEQLLGSARHVYELALGVWPPRQLRIATTLFSDFRPNRLLDDIETDERRTGGRLRLGLLGRNPPRSYQLFVEGQYARVRLDPETASATRRTLTTIDTGGEYRWTERPDWADVLAGAQLRVGWTRSATPYVTLRSAGRLFRPFGPGWAALLEGRAQWVSARTPGFEQASFGGMTSVRGYRPDASLARRLWTLQQELWAPLPGTAGSVEGFRGVLRRYLRLAAFFDVGGVTRTTGGLSSDVRTGLGLGARLLLGPLTLRIDWGHRTTAVLDGHIRGDLYVSARSSASLFLLQ